MRRRGIAALVLSLLLVACATPFDLQGHRGARGLAPENTLAAFEAALAIGVSTLELDTGVTRDGAVVVMHDLRLNPDITRDAAGAWFEPPGPTVASLDLAALRSHDVGRIRPGTRYAQTFASQRAVDGERIPTLDALFDRVRALGANHVRFNIETKLDPLQPEATAEPRPFVQALLDVVRRHGLERRVTIQSFDWRTLRVVRELAPAIPTVCLTTRGGANGGTVADPRWTDGLKLSDHGDSVPRLVLAAGCAVWSPPLRDLDPDAVAQARKLGLKTIPWTVNDPADIDRTLDLGVDGIISDYPDRVRDAMAKRGWKLPPQVRAPASN